MAVTNTWFSRLSSVFRARPTQRLDRRLTAESLESRRLLAITDLTEISGRSFQDVNNDGAFTTGGANPDVPLQNVTINLYQDDGDSNFEPGAGAGNDGAPIDSDTTDANGLYSFTGLTAGSYWVEQVLPAGFVRENGAAAAELVTITAQDAEGTIAVTIDTFDEAVQNLSVSSAGSTTDSDVANPANEALGGERDILLELDSATGDANVDVDQADSNRLDFSGNIDALYTFTVAWDGADGDATTLDETGLQDVNGDGVDLTNGGAATGLNVSLGADQANGAVTIEVYTDANNGSSITVPLPDTGTGVADPQFIDFNDPGWATIGGLAGPADFTDVGAIQMIVQTNTVATDGQASLAGSVGPTVFTENFTNFEPMTLGDLVWDDVDNDGVFDAGENGIDNVDLTLFLDDDSLPGVSGGDTLVDTATTAGGGLYSFTDLFPGDYYVVVDASNFNAGGALEGFTTSTGNDPAPDPDDDVNDDDNGTVNGATVVSGVITLENNNEPVSDGDGDDGNLTVDFGFFSSADLQIVKSDAPDDFVVPGEQIVYTLTVTNNGPADATGVEVTDTLPNGVTVDTVELNGAVTNFNQNGNVLTIDVGALPSDAGNNVATVTITVTVDAGTVGPLTNDSSVTGDQNDPIPGNNTDDEPITARLEIDLELDKQGPATVVAGESLTYTIDVTNNGPSDASNLDLTDTLPVGVTATEVRIDGTVTAFTQNGQTIQLDDFLASLPNTNSTQIAIDVDVASSVADGATLTNNASVTADEFETNTQNNADSVDTTVNREIDLVLDKQGPATIAPGGTINYTIDVTNNGPSDATNLDLTDTLPVDVTATAVRVNGANTAFTQNGQTIQLDDFFATLADQDSVTIAIDATVDAAATGTLTNNASVTADETETNTANNADSVDTTVQVDPASIGGFVYVDFDNDGVFDPGEPPIPGVTVTLTGDEDTGAPVNQSTITDTDGSYLFDDLNPGTYTITETQPNGFGDGIDTAGTPAPVGQQNNDEFASIDLNSGVNGVNYNFGELRPQISKRDFLASSTTANT